MARNLNFNLKIYLYILKVMGRLTPLKKKKKRKPQERHCKWTDSMKNTGLDINVQQGTAPLSINKFTANTRSLTHTCTHILYISYLIKLF